MYYTNKKNLLILILLFFLALTAKVVSLAETKANSAENILYKVELTNTNYKTVIIKLFTEEKYQVLPQPIKKNDKEYVIFLPATANNVSNIIKRDNLKGIIENVKTEYLPLLSQNSGYTKIFVTTSNEEIELFVENFASSSKKPEENKSVNISLSKEKPKEIKIIPVVTKEQTKEKTDTKLQSGTNLVATQISEAGASKDYDKRFSGKTERLAATAENNTLKAPSHEIKTLTKPEPEKTEPIQYRYINKELKVKDYSPAIYIALIILCVNLAILYLYCSQIKFRIYIKKCVAVCVAGVLNFGRLPVRKKSEIQTHSGIFFRKKSFYDGNLFDLLNKKIKPLKENDLILIFSENSKLIKEVYSVCKAKNLNLHIATANSEILADYLEKVKITEFKFADFYKHRDFYKKLSVKPTGFIFDIDQRFDNHNYNNTKFQSSEAENKTLKAHLYNFDFIKIKNYVDINYTNLCLILSLIFKDMQNMDSFIIFTDSDKELYFNQNDFLTGQIQKSTMTALKDLLNNIKISDNELKNKIYYTRMSAEFVPSLLPQRRLKFSTPVRILLHILLYKSQI